MNYEDHDQWDFSTAEERPAVKRGRSVVSVAFPSDALQTVCDAAARSGTTVSAFIRDAAIDRSRPAATIYTVTGSIGVTPQMRISNTTLVGRRRVTVDPREITT